MARTKFNTIRIEYAGADLVDGGMLADTEDALGVSMRYSTDAVAGLGADYVALDNAGNAEGATRVSVAVDYETEGAMLAGMLARKAFADGHQRGTLRYVVEGGGSNASISVELYYQPAYPEFGINREAGQLPVETFWEHYLTEDNVQEYVDFLNSDAEGGLQGVAVASVEDGVLTLTAAGAYRRAAGNVLELEAWAPSPFSCGGPFSGGSDAVQYAFSAGLDGFEATSTLAGRWRMVYRYSFVLGAAVDGV